MESRSVASMFRQQYFRISRDCEPPVSSSRPPGCLSHWDSSADGGLARSVEGPLQSNASVDSVPGWADGSLLTLGWLPVPICCAAISEGRGNRNHCSSPYGGGDDPIVAESYKSIAP